MTPGGTQGANRHQLLGRRACDAGSPSHPAQARQRPHHPNNLHRRGRARSRPRLSGYRSRQVRGGGVERIPGPGDQAPRAEIDHRGAGRFSDRLGGSVDASMPLPSKPTRRPWASSGNYIGNMRVSSRAIPARRVAAILKIHGDRGAPDLPSLGTDAMAFLENGTRRAPKNSKTGRHSPNRPTLTARRFRVPITQSWTP